MKNVSFDEMLVVPSHQLIVKKDIENNMGHQQAVKEHIFRHFNTKGALCVHKSFNQLDKL